METRSAFWVDNFSLNFVVDTHFDAFFFLKKLSMLCVPVFIFTSGRKLFILSVLTGKMETRSAFWVDNFSLNFVVDTHFDAFFFLKKLSMLCVPVFIFTSGGTHVVV